MQPWPAAVTAYRKILSCTSPAAKTPGISVAVLFDLTITHEIGFVRKIADRIALWCDGELICIGTVKDMNKTKESHVGQFTNGLPMGPFTAA